MGNQLTGRRAFLRKAGQVAPAALVPCVATAIAPMNKDREQDEAAIRGLFQEYVRTHERRLLQDPAQSRDTIEVDATGRVARARFHSIMQTSKPFVGRAPLLEMARMQGQEGETSWRAGVHELHCVKVAGKWQIRLLTYRKGDPVWPI